MNDQRDFIIVPRGVWLYLSALYKGQMVRRFSVIQNRTGALFRMCNVPVIKLSLMRRGEKLKMPKLVPLELRTTIGKFL